LIIYLATTPKVQEGTYRIQAHALTTPHLGADHVDVLMRVRYSRLIPRPGRLITIDKLQQQVNSFINANTDPSKTWEKMAQDIVNSLYPANDVQGISVQIFADKTTDPNLRTTASYTRGYVSQVSRFDAIS
jgi:hypothetical protein